MNVGDRVMFRHPHPLAGKRGEIQKMIPGHPGVLVSVSLDRGGSAWARAALVKADPYVGGTAPR